MKKLRSRIREALAKLRFSVHINPPEGVYDQDGIWTLHNHDFMQDPKFCKAYKHGAQHVDYKIQWRAYIAVWCAQRALEREGDFVECGVNFGNLSVTIMDYLDWNQLDRNFYLLDAFGNFSGHDSKNDMEERLSVGQYIPNLQIAQKTFSEWERVNVIQGLVPGTLTRVETKKIAYQG